MRNIFANGKNQPLAKLIETNPTNSYKVVDTYLTANRRFFGGYCALRVAEGEPYANRNNIIWELINMLQEDGDELEV